MSLLSRLKNALQPKALDTELRDEISDHIARRAAALRERGLSESEAQLEASRRFGNATQLREQSREIRLSTTIETTFQDLRYAWRGMLKSPAFAATAILSLALAIGANTAIYSIVDAALLRPLPVAEPQRLVFLATPNIQVAGQERPAEDMSFSYPLYQEFRAAAGDFARLALLSHGIRVEVRIPGKEAPIEKATRSYVSGDAFDILGVPPALGRVVSTDDDRAPGASPNIVISFDYWQRRFHGNPQAVGQRVLLEGVSYSIVGVARQGFFGVEPGTFVDLWIPAMMYNKAAFTNRGWGWFRIIGRLAPGVTAAQLRARLQPPYSADAREQIRLFPNVPPGIAKQIEQRRILVHSASVGPSNFRNTFARPLWIVLGVAAAILLIACANVASLLLARATARASEMAMRISLGAGRARLIRQLLTESVLLSLCAGALGWGIAKIAAPLLVAALSEDLDPVRFVLSMDTRVLLFCAAVSTLAAVAFGLLPAWQASGARPATALHGLRTTAGKLRLGRFCVGIQVAFAFTLVIAGATFLFSLRNLSQVNPGFDPHHLAILNVSTELSVVSQAPQVNAFFDELQRRIASSPSMQGVALTQWTPFEGNRRVDQIFAPGSSISDNVEYSFSASPGYFSTMHIPLIAGRDFEPRDRQHSYQPLPVIVNRALARKYFTTENAIGLTFETGPGNPKTRCRIIGVVETSAYGSIREGPRPIAYFVLRDQTFADLYIRSPLDPGSVVATVERETAALGHGGRVHDIHTLDDLIGNTLLREKLLAGLGSVFAFLGLLLAAIGLFGLLNYSVSRRTKEIGVRAALGAGRPSLVMLVVRDMFGMVATGLAVGLACALGLNLAIQSLLFGIRPAEPGVIATASAIFLAASILAGVLPARRAASIDPITALRHE